MQTFKCFMKIVRQNIGLIIMYFSIFLIITISFSNIFSQPDTQIYSDSKIKLTVIDDDNSEVSNALKDLLSERHTVVDIAPDAETLHAALYIRDIEYALFIPAGYGQSVLEGDPLKMESAQVPNSFHGAYVDRLINSYMSTVSVYLDSGIDLSQSLANAKADTAEEVGVTLTQQVQSADVNPIFYYFKFLSYSLMLMVIFGICPVLMVFNKKAIAMRVNASSLPLTKKNIEFGLGTFVFSAVSYIVFIIAGFILYGSEMLTPGSQLCMLNVVCFLCITAAAAYLIGQLATNGSVLSAISNALVLSLCFLGGVFVPTSIMSEGMQNIARFTPTYWYINATELSLSNNVFNSDVLNQIWQSMGIQLLFAAAFLAAALAVSRYKKSAA